MRVVGYEKRTDWPKLGPSLLIATALIVAVRTAKWGRRGSEDPRVCGVDPELDAEVAFAVRLADRVMHALMRQHGSLFPQRKEPVYEAGSEEDVPQ